MSCARSRRRAAGRNIAKLRHGAAGRGLAVAACVRFILAAILLVVVPSGARADGLYLTEQVGPSKIGGEMGRHLEGDFSVRFGFGIHIDGWAVEGNVQLLDMFGNRYFEGDGHYTAETWGVELRRLFPVNPWARLYVRGGLGKMSVDRGGGLADGYRGRSLDYGGGIMVSGRVPLVGFLFAPLFFCGCGPKVSAGAWFDLGEQVVRLRKDRASSLDGVVTTWMLGFSVGGGF